MGKQRAGNVDSEKNRGGTQGAIFILIAKGQSCGDVKGNAQKLATKTTAASPLSGINVKTFKHFPLPSNLL
jgi:hypothetical protein